MTFESFFNVIENNIVILERMNCDALQDYLSLLFTMVYVLIELWFAFL